ncbi:MAG TPA: fibrobacter succinogenes major paralogous domain-containing protein [Bacteroidales bacterium]|nr:fibrobacter succinogenes major paralogous domain-containing protein [Bacteroidales bacterium]
MRHAILILLLFTSVSVFSQAKEVIYILETYDKTKNIDEQKELYIRGQLSTAFANSPLYEAIDLPGIDAMIDINALSEKGYLSPEAKAALGKIPGCKYFLSTELAASDGEITISVKLLEIETLVMVKGKSASEYIKNDRESIIAACKKMISDLFGTGSTSGNSGTSITGVPGTSSTFTDPRDGKTYKTVKIGNQVWMAENLNYTTNSGSWCYDNSVSNCNTYGRLYNWETAKNVCPYGWHLPSKNEFESLLKNIGINGSYFSGEKAYMELLSGGSSGFNALLGGWRDDDGVSFRIGSYGKWWSYSEWANVYAHGLFLYNKPLPNAQVRYDVKRMGLSVRCIKD